MRRIILPALLFFLFGINLTEAQTTLYSESFNGASSTFSLNTADVSSATNGINDWVINNVYPGGSGTLVCLGFPFTFSVPATASQPAGIAGSPNSNYLHTLADASASNNIFNSNFQPADGLCAQAENIFAKMTNDISTTGYTGVKFDFWWMCGGSADHYGEVYYSTNGGTSWTKLIAPISNYFGASSWTATSITNAAFDNQATLRFGFRFANNVGSTASDPGFSIDDVVISGNAASGISVTGLSPTSYCPGASISIPFSAQGSINAGNVFTAELSDAVGSFTNPIILGTLSGTSSGTLTGTIPLATPAGTGYQIRVNASNPVITGTTYPVNITVNAGATAGTATLSADTVCLGSSVSVNLTGSSGSIAWETSTNGTTWSPTGGTSVSFTTTPSGTQTWFRAQVTQPCGTVTSNSVMITAVSPNVAGTLTANPTSVCAGASSVLTLSGSTGNINWEISSNGSTWSPILGGGSTLSTGPLSQTTYFRAQLSNGYCANAVTGPISITVQPNPVAGTAVAATDSICEGDSVSVNLNGASGAITWEVSLDGSNWSGQGNFGNSFMYSSGSPTSFLRAIVGNSCGSDTSNVLTIVVVSANQGGTLMAVPDTICAGENATLSIAGSTGNIGWEISPDGNSWSPIAGTGVSINTGPLTQSTWYRARMTNSICPTAYSGTVQVTVLAKPIAAFSSSTTGLVATFTDNSVGATTWEWDFGDGGADTQQNPSHTYAFDGTYTVTLIVTNNGFCPDTNTVQVTVTGVGREEFMGNRINIYPNPARDQVKIGWERAVSGEIACRLMDLFGKQLYFAELNAQSAPELQLDLGVYPEGIYLIEVMLGDTRHCAKLIIER